MTDKISYNSLLVPTDFSDNAWSAFQHALSLVDGDESEIVVMHVVDPAIIDHVVQMGVGDHSAILNSLRESAAQRLTPYQDVSNELVNVDTLVCEGEPFFEIIRKAEDFAVDAIVMSKLGQRTQAKSMLFGSTAEKVTRGANKPVIVLPIK